MGEAFIHVRRRIVGELGVKVGGWWRETVGVKQVKEVRVRLDGLNDKEAMLYCIAATGTKIL